MGNNHEKNRERKATPLPSSIVINFETIWLISELLSAVLGTTVMYCPELTVHQFPVLLTGALMLAKCSQN